MKKLLKITALMAVMILLTVNVQAQRKMDKLGRGMIVLSKGNGSAYIGWRMLGTDPQNIAFNLYKSSGGGAPVKIAGPLTATTDYTDNAVNTSVTNSYFVKPIINDVERGASASYSLPANAPAKRYIAIPQKFEPDGGPYTSWQTHVGDVDGDGEFEYICVREYAGTTAPTTRSTKIDCYKLNGTLLWRLDLGLNFTYTANGTGSLVVADFDGDGKAEVALRTFEETIFRYGSADSVKIGDTNGDGKTNYRRTDGFVNDGPEFLSVLNGETGRELSRIPFEPSNGGDAWTKFGANERPVYIYFAVAYLDGVLPSIVTVRGAGGDNTPAFAFDYRNGQLTERWRWVPGVGQGLSQAHNILAFDLDNDGKDEIAFLGSALDDNGKTMYANTDFSHGDHFRILDMDPDRPGYEIFSIQQNNASLIGMSINDGANGKYLKKWFLSQLGDLSRGDAGDYSAAVKGAECYSTMGGLYSCKGDKVSDTGRFPVWGIWWDSDLQRELINGVNGSGTAPAIDKWPTSRIFSIYSDNGSSQMPYGGHPAYWGDILGDWREEIIVETTDYSEIRIYSTWDPAINRLYTLMQNPGYRMENNCKGRIGAAFPDYYLGSGMQTPPPPPMVDAKLHWKGTAGNNTWDAGATSNWLNNATAAAFSPTDSVLFDLTGYNTAPIVLSDSLKPGNVTVYSPIDYTFAGTGSIAGATTLTKAGKGSLILNTKNTYTGNTTVWDGAFIVNDTLTNSSVTVYGGTWGGPLSKGLTGGRIGGRGRFAKNVSIEYNGAIVPGAGVGVADTLTFQSLTEKFGAVNYFDLYSDSIGKSDLIRVLGDLTFADTVTMNISMLNFTLAPGTYPLFKCSGTFNGNISKIKVVGLSQFPYKLTYSNGTIALTINSIRNPAKVVWAGTGNQWDLANSSNWLQNGASTIFATRDSVLFDNTGSAIKTIILNNDLYVNDLIFDGTTNYTIAGGGAICGTTKLTKRGSSTVRLAGKHKFVGATSIEAGTLEIGTLDDGGASCSLGSASATVGNIQLMGGSKLHLYDIPTSTNRPVVITNGECSLSAASGSTMSILAVVSGNGTLVKSGAGNVQLNATNTYTGGTIVREGILILGSSNANKNGLGTGNVTLDGGTLNMINVQANDVFTRNIIVSTGSTGGFGIDGRCSITSTLTGGGTLNLYSPYVRGDLSGNWSAFTGQINVTGVDFRVNNAYGLANASIDLASGVTAYRNGGTALAVGAISGVVGSTMSATPWTVGSKNTDATFAGIISGNSVTKVGTGSWTLTGANTYTSGTSINGGKLLVNNTTGSGTGTGTVNVFNTGALGGTGIITGLVNINNGGTLAPGTNGIGNLTINNAVNMVSGSSTEIQLNKSTGTRDLLTVVGTLTLNGTLKVELLGNTPPVAGDKFKIFAATTIAGSFQSISPSTPGAGLIWDTSELLTTGTLGVATSTSIENLNPAGISVFPNPTTGKMTVRTGSAKGKTTLYLESANGEILLLKTVMNPSGFELDLTGKSPGLYFIKLVSDKETSVLKVIKN